MGADERLFESQRDCGLDFEVPRLPTPEPSDDMPTYAARVRDMLGLNGPCILGGVSFGGMLACQLATMCQARAVVLVATCQNRDAIPGYYHGAEFISRFLPDGLIRRRCEASSRLLAKLEKLDRSQYELIRDMSLCVPVLFLRRVARMILRWNGIRSLACPVYHIHGRLDRVIPIKHVQPAHVVADGGHLINMTHADEVNQFIAQSLDASCARCKTP